MLWHPYAGEIHTISARLGSDLLNSRFRQSFLCGANHHRSGTSASASCSCMSRQNSVRRLHRTSKGHGCMLCAAHLRKALPETGGGQSNVPGGHKVLCQLMPDRHLHATASGDSLLPEEPWVPPHQQQSSSTFSLSPSPVALVEHRTRWALGQLISRVSMARVSGDDTQSAPSNLGIVCSLSLSCLACSRCNPTRNTQLKRQGNTACRRQQVKHVHEKCSITAGTCRCPFSVSLGLKICGSLKSFPAFVAALYSDSPCRMMNNICVTMPLTSLFCLAAMHWPHAAGRIHCCMQSSPCTGPWA